MIELSPKALRFARLVAETQLRGASDARVDELRDRESRHAGSATRYSSISDELARFCLQKISSFLEAHPAPTDGDWDGNDIAYLTSISNYLAENLSVTGRL